MNSPLVEQLIERRGIGTDYIDAWGNPAKVNEASVGKLLSVMGYATQDEKKLAEQLEQEDKSAWSSALNPVVVLRTGAEISFPIRLPIDKAAKAVTLELTTEQGETTTESLIATEHNLIQVNQVGKTEIQEYMITLNWQPGLGYHDVVLKIGKKQAATMRLIIAPTSCYHPQEIIDGNKLWGLSVQLYCLRSAKNWGIGDFTDLSFLVQQSANQGAGFIGLNPIHALYPANPGSCSPYGPSSRRWLNFIYIDVTAIEGYEDASVQALVNEANFQSALQHVRNVDYVDYEAVTKLKLEALAAIFDVYYEKYLKKNTKQNRAFKAFIEEGGESLDMLAVYDTLQESLASEGKPSWGWAVFPEEYSEYHKPDVAKFKKKNLKRVKFFLFLQWQAALQLQAASDVADDAGMTIGLYRDLAVGVSEGSAEIWGNRELYCTEASVGAPPDVLGPLGQNWGLPPMDPHVLYQQQYQPIIDLFRANMQSSGALRIDHVMALLRLWWVVKGDDAKEGGYVYYPVEDLLAILALESHRSQSLVIGEDLGTVPEEIRSKLADNGMYSYRVFFFEQAEDGGFFSPSHYPVQSMSTLTTHDMPTLTGYWHCLDLELGKELGLYPTEEILQTLYTDRHDNKQQILDSLHGHGSIPDWVGRQVEQVGMSRELNFGLQKHMAAGSSALLSLQLEDWLEMDKPVNIPGTSDEYPNWKRKLSESLEYIFAQPDLQGLSAELTRLRQQAGK